MGLYRNYILILAAIPSVCLFVSLGVFGAPYIGRLGMGGALGGAITAYVRTLVSVLIAAVIVEKLAPTFGSRGDTAQALKLVAYACTPVWLAGVFYLIWFLAAPANAVRYTLIGSRSAGAASFNIHLSRSALCVRVRNEFDARSNALSCRL